MTEHIQAAIKEAERVSKKQKICANKTSDSLSNLIDELTAAKHQLASEGSQKAVFQDLNKRLAQLDTVSKISEQTKDLHSTVNKLSKAGSILSDFGLARKKHELTACSEARKLCRQSTRPLCQTYAKPARASTLRRRCPIRCINVFTLPDLLGNHTDWPCYIRHFSCNT